MIKVKIENFKNNEIKCPCCGISLVNDKTLVCLQGFRYFLNNKYGKDIKLHITSGYRCNKHNAQIKGAKNSCHMFGLAYDLISYDINSKELYESAIECNLFTTIIYYEKLKFIHVDTRKRSEVKSWVVA